MSRLAQVLCATVTLLLVALPLVRVVAQPLSASSAQTLSTVELIALGDRESSARRGLAALERYELALQQDPRDYAALWKASREAVDLGEFESQAARRTMLYAKATDYAKRAVVVNPNDAEAHFHLARALGRTALALSARERVRYAIDIRTQALRTLELQPGNAGALHIMGVWNAEIMRLGSIQRLFAKTFMGGQIFATASWVEATRYMEQAVTIEPQRLVHRLDLARVYRDNGRAADARVAYQAAIKSPTSDPNDDIYRKSAEQELTDLR